MHVALGLGSRAREERWGLWDTQGAGWAWTQCGQKPSGELNTGNVFPCCWFSLRLRRAAGGVGRRSVCAYIAAQQS